MPLYDFLCESCNDRFEVKEGMAEHSSERPCRSCGGTARTVIHNPMTVIDNRFIDYDYRHAVVGENPGMTAAQHKKMYEKSVAASRKAATRAKRSMGKRHDVGIRRIGTIPKALFEQRRNQSDDSRYWETDTKKKLQREDLFFGD
jgi:putative FmdB family regulatory protein